MTTSSPENVNFAIYFEEIQTLAEMIEVLTELEAGYQECVRALEPPPDFPLSSPQISIRSGSLFVEFTAAVQTGAWSAAGLILLRALLTDTEPVVKVALLPIELVGQISDELHKRREIWRERRLAKRKRKIDEEAQAAIEAAERAPDAAEPAPAAVPATSTPSSPPGEGSAEQLVLRSDPATIDGAQRVLFDCAEFARGLQLRTAGLEESVDHLIQFPLAAIGHVEGIEEAVGPLHALHQQLDEVKRLLGLAREGFTGQMGRL